MIRRETSSGPFVRGFLLPCPGTRLSIEKSAIHGDDAKLRVEVTSGCRPVVK